MAQNSRVTDALIQKNYENMLRKTVEGDDIFSQFRADITGEGKLPGSIIAVSKQSGQTSKVLGLIKALSGAGISGRNSLAGNEEKLEILDFTAYANEFKWGVNAEAFGIDAVANKPYALLKLAVPLLGELMEKYKGTHRREALNQRYSSNLVEAPSSRVQHINANLHVAGVAISSQPAYSDTLATYATAINTAIPDTPAAGNQMTFAAIKTLEKWVLISKRIKPLANGKYIVTVPTNQKYILMDEDSGLGKVFKNSTESMKSLKNWIGEWSRFVFVEDFRNSVLTATDGASSTLVWSYTTVDDSRPTVGADKWDVGYVLGMDALIELELEALHLEKDNTVEYGREQRTGAFANYGDQLLEWADGTDVRRNYGSAVVLYVSEY